MKTRTLNFFAATLPSSCPLLVLLLGLGLTLGACAHPKTLRDPAQSTTVLSPAADSAPKSKYAATTTPLNQDHGYFRANAAPDFWKLIAYYVPQEAHACSAASLAMILNALNSDKKLTTSDENIRQLPLIEKLNDKRWKAAIDSGNCLDLESLAEVVRTALKAYGYTDARVDVIHVVALNARMRSRVVRLLQKNEESTNDYIIANFIQGAVTGDAEAMNAGHMSPIGAYDAVKGRVLIMDTDRDYYEPYWAPIQNLLDGMNTIDTGAKEYRGLMHISLGKK